MNLKIAVVYNNEPKLYELIERHPEIYVPILAGRAVTKKSYDIPNLLYDDVGDNISWMNPYVNEITAIYWIGKHLDALGNPDFIGLQHYRRIFLLDRVLEHVKPGTLILNEETLMLPMIDFMTLCHDSGNLMMDVAHRVLQMNRPDINALFYQFAHSRTYYSRNLFIVPRNVMSGLTTYIELMLRHIAIDINYDMFGTPGCRNIGFIMERMVGFYFLLLSKEYGFTVHPTMFAYIEQKDTQ